MRARHAAAGMWTSMGVGAKGGACALLWSCSRLQEVRPMRTTRHQCHVTLRSRAPSELWLDSNLFVTLPASINDVSRAESDRKCFWPAPGLRPADHPGLPDVESPGLLIRFTRPLRGNHP